MRILLIEDDLMIGRGLRRSLGREGVSVDWVRDGAEGAEAAASGEHDMVLLDLGLPGIGGLEVLRRMRAAGVRTPVVIVTAREEIDDRVRGLDLGADDYVVKPFATEELLARIRAVSRRRSGAAESLLHAGDFCLNLAERTLSRGDDSAVLPAREFALMRALMERPGAILSRAQLEDRLYGWGEEVESNAVDVLIHSVRKKFGKNVIRNIRGAGWVVSRNGS